ncbi:MAG TPA: outer membrane protein assembly factor BamE [Gammaproteobacteria bacterium]|jgi:outer membrane protein assembly factor BamE|nr:outer membrane protein assembly factor BamE [Gammaproteobacteria bacterium]|tara:strand:+ start:1308 stop:1733 length:426 start_codon:yes stop_codon:yes gene_type:complete
MKYIYVAFLAFSVGACSLSQLKLPELKIPRVYKLSVQQGNVITQEMVDRLKPGMTRNQVEFVMGKPVLGDPFNDDQWVYIYTLEVPDYFNQVFKMVLAFEDDTLATISGDYIPQEADAESDAAADEGANETSDETEAESAG